MFRDTISAIQRWNYRGGRPNLTARVSNRISAIAFAAGIGPSHAATLEVRGHKTGRLISFPVVVADYKGGRYLVAMLGRRFKRVGRPSGRRIAECIDVDHGDRWSEAVAGVG